MSRIRSFIIDFLKTILLEPLEIEILEVNKRVLDLQQIMLDCKTCARVDTEGLRTRLEVIEVELRDLLTRENI